MLPANGRTQQQPGSPHTAASCTFAACTSVCSMWGQSTGLPLPQSCRWRSLWSCQPCILAGSPLSCTAVLPTRCYPRGILHINFICLSQCELHKLSMLTKLNWIERAAPALENSTTPWVVSTLNSERSARSVSVCPNVRGYVFDSPTYSQINPEWAAFPCSVWMTLREWDMWQHATSIFCLAFAQTVLPGRLTDTREVCQHKTSCAWHGLMPDKSWGKVQSWYVWHAVRILSYGMQYVPEPMAILQHATPCAAKAKGMCKQSFAVAADNT